MLITFNKTYYYHIAYASVVSFINAIDTRCITIMSFYVHFELFNELVFDICLFFQCTIIINSYTFACLLFILQCCQDEGDDLYWGILGAVVNTHIILLLLKG